jgi:hypothetical protein
LEGPGGGNGVEKSPVAAFTMSVVRFVGLLSVFSVFWKRSPRGGSELEFVRGVDNLSYQHDYTQKHEYVMHYKHDYTQKHLVYMILFQHRHGLLLQQLEGWSPPQWPARPED